KVIYGLRQSPRYWYGTVDKHVVEINFKNLNSCVYIFSEGGSIYILTHYVDAALLLGKGRKVLERIKRDLMRRFSMNDMGEVSLVLMMEVTRDRTRGANIIAQKDF
ncbi:unnamed protein product, partial [Ascophyllum nodosum]